MSLVVKSGPAGRPAVSDAHNELRRRIGLFVFQTNHCHFVNKGKGSQGPLLRGHRAPHHQCVLRRLLWFSNTLSILNTICSVCWCMYDSVVCREILKVHVPNVMSDQLCQCNKAILPELFCNLNPLHRKQHSPEANVKPGCDYRLPFSKLRPAHTVPSCVILSIWQVLCNWCTVPCFHTLLHAVSLPKIHCSPMFWLLLILSIQSLDRKLDQKVRCWTTLIYCSILFYSDLCLSTMSCDY